jgi:NurA-like 5'-3' nuclease
METNNHSKIIKALREREAGVQCQICEHRGMSVLDIPSRLDLYRSSDRNENATPHYVAVVICPHCGHVRLHSLQMLGLQQGSGDETEGC